ncbi:hypothetical protein [Rhodobacter maris]|uniref:Uncharacterized protein n=1 Tax=Rhodobacter maris TaxID=446682 RepID=A0A285STP9_9RHOB|nr:hypothetical protein [Rhodobacter maris]SOC09610.1 hypothetical protein SAMN05877831_107160 [Rhodobacter maris]
MGNVLKGASDQTGIKTKWPSLGMRDNLIIGVGTAVHHMRPGVIGPQHMRPLDADPAPMAAASDVAGPSGMQGWTWETPEITFVPGETTVKIFKQGTRIDGDLQLWLNARDGSSYDVITGRLIYDGATLQFRPVRRQRGGTVQFKTANYLGKKDGILAVVVANSGGAAVENIRPQAAFTGFYQWGV